MTLQQIGEQLETKRTAYQQRWDAYPTVRHADGSESKDIPNQDLPELKSAMAEIERLASDQLILQAAAQVARPAARPLPVNRVSTKSVASGPAQALFESGAWAHKVGGKFEEVELRLSEPWPVAGESLEGKATMTTAAGFPPMRFRDGVVVPLASRPPQLLDFIRADVTEQNAIRFMRQTVRTNGAGAKGEGVALDVATIEYAEATVDIRRIGVILPVTEEQLEDEPGVRTLIEDDLRLMVRQRMDEQITVGDGTAPNLMGLSNLTNALTQARGTDTELDQILKAMTRLQTEGRCRPNLVVMHTNNFRNLAFTKTQDGKYLMGSPGEAPFSRVWGLPIAVSEALPEGTALILDTDYVRLKIRRDITMASTDSHADQFASNRLTLRAHVRCGLQVLREQAVCRLTGLRA